MDPKEEAKLLQWYNEVEFEETNAESSKNDNVDQDNEFENNNEQTSRGLNLRSLENKRAMQENKDHKAEESTGEASRNRRGYLGFESDDEEPFPPSESEYKPSSESETESEAEPEIINNDEDIDQPIIIPWNEVDGTSLNQLAFIDLSKINVPI